MKKLIAVTLTCLLMGDHAGRLRQPQDRNPVHHRRPR